MFPSGDRRRLRYHLRDTLHEVSGLPRVGRCGRRVVATKGGVEVRLAALVAHFANLQLCGSVWACPVCGPRIRETRAREIEGGLVVHAERGGGAGFLTCTVRHHDGQQLGRLFEVITSGYRSILGSTGWRQDVSEFGIVGTVRAAEITHGPNGWHPHLHSLVLTEVPLPDSAWTYLADRFYARWRSAVMARGLAEPTRAHGVHLSAVRSTEDVARYTSKFVDAFEKERSVGRELARHDLKQARRPGHRTPFTLLGDFDATGEAGDLALWREYEVATKGKSSVHWSRGLKGALEVAEQSDDEIVAEEIGGEVLEVLSRPEWSYVLSRRLRAFLLEVAEGGRASLDDVMRVIRRESAKEREDIG